MFAFTAVLGGGGGPMGPRGRIVNGLCSLMRAKYRFIAPLMERLSTKSTVILMMGALLALGQRSVACFPLAFVTLARQLPRCSFFSQVGSWYPVGLHGSLALYHVAEIAWPSHQWCPMPNVRKTSAMKVIKP